MPYDQKVYIEFARFVASGRNDLLQSFLSEYKDLDITYYNEPLFNYGTFLIMAVAGDTERGNVEITKLLLNHYKTKQLSKLDPCSKEYNQLQTRLEAMLDLAVEGERISAEMNALLAEYIDREQDLKGFEEETHDISGEHHPSTGSDCSDDSHPITTALMGDHADPATS